MSALRLLALLLLFPFASVARAESTPPSVLASPAARYPEGESASVDVLLFVRIDAKGEVIGVEAEPGAEGPFVAAAKLAALQWRFEPARQDGVPTASRIRIPFLFRPPVEVSVDAGPPPEPVDAGPSVPLRVLAVDAGPQPEPVDGGADASPEVVRVRGARRPPERGASDFQLERGALAEVATPGAKGVLEMAPGIFLANEGGEGHAEQVFLRGFNAGQGQQIEFLVQGVPVNEADNPDSHGYADTHFVIPELIRNLRVLEGPFDPHQGDFAVAGSAEFELGVKERGLRGSLSRGSFGTTRLLGLWAPGGQREGTFAAVEVQRSDGYGANRAYASGSAMAQYEGELGERGLWRLFAQSYASHYRSAGPLRLEDIQSGKVDVFGTYDASQGGDVQRHGVSFQLESPLGAGVTTQQAFLTFRSLRILENFTGFLLDDQEQGQSLHPQRGDGVLKSYEAITAGARGSYRVTRELFGQEQALELGWYGRYDRANPTLQRVRFGTQIPYAVDADHQSQIVDVAGYLDVALKATSLFELRGGVRQELFSYVSEDLCATAGSYQRGAPLDESCPAADRSGARLPSSRSSATGQATLPRLTALVHLPRGFTLTGSGGVGAQSLPASEVTQEQEAPFTRLTAWELGARWKGRVEPAELQGRLLGFRTHVDRDLLFDPALGRLAAADGTTRMGLVAVAQASGSWFEALGSATWASARFDDGALVPYVPSVVVRADGALFHDLPVPSLLGHGVSARIGAGLSFLGTRALPLGQEAQPTFKVDGSAGLRWRLVDLALRADNLTDARYPLSQFFYASDFRSRAYPTLAPAAHVTVAAPRTLLFTLGLRLDAEDE